MGKISYECLDQCCYQVFYDFDAVRNEIDQETDKLAGQNKVCGLSAKCTAS